MAPPLTGSRWRRQVARDWRAAAAGWERWEPQILASLSAVDPALIRALELKDGHRVLDFGCGSGEPALSIAPLVAPGRVLGLDISRPMIAIARRRAALRGASNARFAGGDDRALASRGRFDRIVSRYSLMFVDDVAATLKRLRQALRPGGRIAIAVWGPTGRNPYFALRAAAVRRFLTSPAPDPEQSPHPMRLARSGLLPRLLRAAGFRAVRGTGVRAPFVFRSEEEYVEMNVGASGSLAQLYHRLPRARQRQLRAALARSIRRFRSGGVIRCPGFAWVVSGRR